MKKVLLAAATLAVSVTAWAYIPPAFFMVKTIAAKHSSPKGVRFKGVVTQYEGEAPSAVHFKVTTVLREDLGVARSWASDDAGAPLYYFEQRLSGQEPLSVMANVIPALLLDSNPVRMAEVLRKEGVPIRPEADAPSQPAGSSAEQEVPANEHLARWGKTFAWVIGNHRPGKRDPQLWVEKDTFHPVRFIPLTGPADFEFENFRYFHEFPFPRAITQIQDKKIVFKVESPDLLKNPASDIAAMKAPVNPGFTDLGNASPGAVRDLIRKYFEGR